MPTNKGALIRRQVLDRCLSSNRNFTLHELMEKCNDTLVEHGFRKVTSENTIRTDLFELEAQYTQAEIVPIRKGRNIYYHYKDPNFSIYKIPLTDDEILGLTQAVSVLSRFDGMPGFEWLDRLIKRFKPSINIDTDIKSIVGFDENPNLKGKEHFAPLLKSILGRQVLIVRYCGYRNPQETNLIIHPYFIKEYNNRWFLLGLNDELGQITTLAFDRILEFTPIVKTYKPNTSVDFSAFFNDMIGVSRSPEGTSQEVRLFISNSQLPYILSKPLHNSQRIVEKSENGAVLSLNVIFNYELEREILSLGDYVKVLYPPEFADKIKNRISKANNLYQ